ncbi:hypothetical protein O3P69_011403 [Scylla paramamosain]|uniref:Uncharacterized protein n=1 Tax=Scylla paramamosain TaxID=85552 RepID=A0AAW0T6I5_SCYPA
MHLSGCLCDPQPLPTPSVPRRHARARAASHVPLNKRVSGEVWRLWRKGGRGPPPHASRPVWGRPSAHARHTHPIAQEERGRKGDYGAE